MNDFNLQEKLDMLIIDINCMIAHPKPVTEESLEHINKLLHEIKKEANRNYFKVDEKFNLKALDEKDEYFSYIKESNPFHFDNLGNLYSNNVKDEPCLYSKQIMQGILIGEITEDKCNGI